MLFTTHKYSGVATLIRTSHTMRNSYLASALAALLMVTSCDRRGDDDNLPRTEEPAIASPSTRPVTDHAVTPGAATTPLDADESLALGLLVAANAHELQAAQQAMVRKLSPDTMEYARNTEKDLISNLALAQAMGTLADTPEVQAMKEKSASDLAMLDKQSDSDYEAAFLYAMVKDHAGTLALIDGRLLPLSTAGPVREYLDKARGEATRHLQAAKKIQATSSR